MQSVNFHESETTRSPGLHRNTIILLVIVVLLIIFRESTYAQSSLNLKDALKIATDNYGIIKAKADYANASNAGISQAKLDYLPNLNFATQADYGTANGQTGPAYSFGPTGIASSGIPLNAQNWNSAFGGLYLANVNWDFFTFGRSTERVKVASATFQRDERDAEQEIFQHKVRVSAAYLNLLAAQRLTSSYKKNLARADTLRRIIAIKAKHGLVAGVDSSQANSEVSNAKSTLLKAIDFEDEQNSNLIKLLGTGQSKILADTVFISKLPVALSESQDTISENHPVIEFYKSRISLSEEQEKYYRTLGLPAISLGAAMQTRSSGFASNYNSNQENYTTNFYQGIKPDRTNYVVALGVSWNITQPFRTRQQVRSQRFTSEGLKAELEQAKHQLFTQLSLSDSKIKNAIADYYETPKQVKAASDVFQQKSILYKQGLTNLVDVTQALYALVRAEADRDIAYNNVWQALLVKAAAQGDFNIFYKNL